MNRADRFARRKFGERERIEIRHVRRVGLLPSRRIAGSMVMETSAKVCVCQLLRPRELNMPSTDSEFEKIPQ